ncbi:MAG TPA: hypothetical protein VF851_09725 [Steroidobacteraceae bacterium]
MTDRDRSPEERLDAQLRALPRTLEPARDLWPEIASGLEPHGQASRRRPAWIAQVAAALLLVAGSSLLTATLLDRGPAPGRQSVQAREPAGQAAKPGGFAPMPAGFGPNVRLDPEYAAARRQLTVMLQARLAALPPSTRAKLETNLGEMQRAAEQINAALAEQPGDPLLEELLLKTYQDELAVLANVNQLTAALAAAPATEKRIQL